MENNRVALHNFEQEKTQERKRKAAYLESIFETAEKKPNQDRVNNNKDGLSSKDPAKHNGCLNVNSSRNMEGPAAESGRCDDAESRSVSGSQQVRATSNLTNPEAPKLRENATSMSQGSLNAGFKTPGGETNTRHKSTRECEEKREDYNKVIVKQEENNGGLPVQIVSVHGNHEEKAEENVENRQVGDDYMKFLLFAGKLYHCERVSDLTHNFPAFAPENLQARKGKVVVLLLFHKTFREVVNYVVGVVDHATSEYQTIAIKIVKSQTYPSTLTPTKGKESKELKFVVGSKKLLCNLQSLDGPIYGELVKILDGFGANSVVDHSKISEFNAMINANADRLDSQVSSYVSSLPNSFVRTSSMSYASPAFGYLDPRASRSNVRYSPLGNRPSIDSRYSPVRSPGGAYGSLPERPRSTGPRGEVENGLPKQAYTSHGGVFKGEHGVYTVAANQTVRITPGIYSSDINNEHSRVSTEIAVPAAMRFHSDRDERIAQERSNPSQRRNVEDLQTVAELCKEKMKRDMAEQELKSIKAAFEEFKSRMQHHLSQVEERMVLLEAENRNLKGKLSNMHQTNGYAEKKYHELRSRLEELLKSV